MLSTSTHQKTHFLWQKKSKSLIQKDIKKKGEVDLKSVFTVFPFLRKYHESAKSHSDNKE